MKRILLIYAGLLVFVGISWFAASGALWAIWTLVGLSVVVLLILLFFLAVVINEMFK